MSLSFAQDWLGCLDYKMSQSVWQVALYLYENNIPIIPPEAVFEAYTPDDYYARPPEMMAFLEIFSITIIPYPPDPGLPFELLVGNYANWRATADYILTFNPDLSNAPCTQQTFP